MDVSTEALWAISLVGFILAMLGSVWSAMTRNLMLLLVAVGLDFVALALVLNWWPD